MKSVITAICLLIPLVVIFIIIDRKDFYSGDNVVTPQDRNGREIDSLEQNNGTKPADVKPVAKPVTEEKLVPAAIPVVTAEEAEKLNAEAKDYLKMGKERREPFFRLYENSSFESVTFEGTIRATSTIMRSAR